MHLYLHIPFCEKKCHYCAFTSLQKRDYEKAYFEALYKDINFQFTQHKIAKKSIQTVFIGGGTPSVIQVQHYEKLFHFLNDFLAHNAELSIEANPNSSTFLWLKTLREFGINRISFGIQSFNEQKLHFLGRIHSTQEIFHCIENAYKAGYRNINADLIYDTKLDTKKMLHFELEHLARLQPLLSHISAYSLTLEPNTKFAKKTQFKKNATNLMKYYIKGIQNLGFTQYEISNFGKNCQHNLAYWQGKEYLGCGLSAISFYDKKRFYTAKNLKQYLQNPTARNVEHLNTQDLHLEHLFLGLRSIVGIEKKRLNPQQLTKAQFLCKSKKLLEKNERFYNTNFLLSDELALYLYP
ncbi:radical SAM family heme chaperone HemW [Campylobacter sp. MIT 21-1685]|uniref:radical SAM family heme chaperone HemW n=1 Tax=unclassified Campylobacter TaxID=2593542 RepID=UPI00224B9F97|nr:MULTISPECIES: radical SAM family heme chaperone HemW [unclassified Campylobacter]MCX2682362.1 radical SAM family heme chaperone HemW [Campylobacter sp. MIT 21-1684]MCX2750642.1 radical SAM family heme chaperone HemW [Campylobacter sp. MIT 21-1682]MCX2806810.1 radical SAM family heme chaperone HemW [Campylobacter sp. MIT 21-1685]